LDKGCPGINRLTIPFGQIVENDNFITSVKQLFNTDTSDITGTPCDKDFH
jgi:hypothetical protein